MGMDFSVKRIVTLGTTDNDLAGVQVIRNATALTYKLARVSLSKVALAADYQIVDSTTVSAKVDRQNATPTRFVGNSTNGTDGTAAFAVASLSLKQSSQARQLGGGVVTVTLNAAGTGYTAGDFLTVVQTGSLNCQVQVLTVTSGAVATFAVVEPGAKYTVANALSTSGGSGAGAKFNVTVVDRTVAANLTYASGYALAASEVYKVKVDGVLKTVTTDYTVSGENIVFVAGKEPANGARVEILALSNSTPLTDEVTVVTVNGVAKTVDSDYTLSIGVVTFAAGHVPTAGQQIAIFFRTPGTRVYTGVSLTGLDAENSATATANPKVYVKVGTGEYGAIDAGDFTWTGPNGTTTPGSVSFDADKIPADGSLVQIRYQLDFNDTFAIPGEVVVGDDDPEVWVDTTKKTVTTDYVITARVVVFTAGHKPTVDQVVQVIDVSAAAGVVPAGGYTFFDSNRGNSPAWDFIRAGGSTVVEIM